MSSQHHSFDIKLASMYGIDGALVIHHFQHWIRINRYTKKNIIDGRCWTYQTRKQIQATFPYWTVEQIRNTCQRLADSGVLIIGSHNKSKIDKTLWYAFADEKAFGVDEESSKNVYDWEKSQSIGKNPNRVGKNPKPIPDTITDTKEEEGNTRAREASLPPPAKTFFSYKNVKMEQSRYDSLIAEFGESKIKEMIARLAEYAEMKPKRFKDYGCHATVIRNWIRRDGEQKGDVQPSNPSKSSFVEENKKLAKAICNKFPNRKKNNTIRLYSDSIEFAPGGIQPAVDLKFTAHGFREQALSQLRKMKEEIEGL